MASMLDDSSGSKLPVPNILSSLSTLSTNFSLLQQAINRDDVDSARQGVSVLTDLLQGLDDKLVLFQE
jgi:hypothetical protein